MAAFEQERKCSLVSVEFWRFTAYRNRVSPTLKSSEKVFGRASEPMLPSEFPRRGPVIPDGKRSRQMRSEDVDE